MYVAFLRAINTGKRRIRMADLRNLYKEMGFSDVATHIATGNVIFSSPSTPPLSFLESQFEQHFGFMSEVFLRSAEEVHAIVAAVPWTGEGDLVEVSLLEGEPAPSSARVLEGTAVEPENLVVSGREVYFLRGLGKGAPTVHKESVTASLLGMRTTRRTMATVRQITERYLE
jgi:uncharacterized protein (DUF1697 family)